MIENRGVAQTTLQTYLVLGSRQLLYFACLCLLLCYCLWSLGVDAILLSPLLSLVILAVGNLLWTWRCKGAFKQAAISILCVISIASVGSVFLSRLYDTSYDGMRAHQAAIIALKNGWNPVKDPSFKRGEEILQKYREISNGGVVTIGTGKLSKILSQGRELQGNIFVGTGYKNNSFYCLAALVFRATGILESAKVIHLLVMLMAFGLTFRYLNSLSCRSAFWLSALISLNPVSIYQLSSFMLDGYTYSLFQLFFVSVLSLFEERNSKVLWLDVVCAGLLLLTSKISGFSYFAAVLVAVVVFVGFGHLRGVPFLAKVRWGLIILSMLVAFASVYSVYRLANIEVHDVRFSSIMEWMSKRDQSRPGLAGIPQLKDQSKFERFLWSSFSATHINPGSYRMKIPGVVLAEELQQLKEGHGEYRTGGFGPLYGLMIVLSGGLLFFRPGLMKARIIILYAVIIGTISWFSPVWWARWAAYQWIIPFLPVLAIGGNKQNVTGNAVFGLRNNFFNGDLLLLVASLNCMLIGLFYFSGKMNMSSEIRGMLKAISGSEHGVELLYSTFPSNQLWFFAEGIHVQGRYVDEQILKNMDNVSDLPATSSRWSVINEPVLADHE